MNDKITFHDGRTTHSYKRIREIYDDTSIQIAMLNRIEELEKLSNPLTKELYKEMTKRHTEIATKNKELQAQLDALQPYIKHDSMCWIGFVSTHPNAGYCTCGLKAIKGEE